MTRLTLPAHAVGQRNRCHDPANAAEGSPSASETPSSVRHGSETGALTPETLPDDVVCDDHVMASDEECVFCRIVRGEAEGSRVIETDTVLAILDIDPVTPGHVLVLPKDHLPALADLSDDVAEDMFSVGRRMAAALRRSRLRCDGINLFYADGEAAFQEVFHAHLHVVPRYPEDGFTIDARWGSNPARAELDANAGAIRSALR